MQLVQDRFPPPSIYIYMCTLYTYMEIHILRFSPSGFFGLSKCLVPTPGLTSEYPTCSVCVCVCVHTPTPTYTQKCDFHCKQTKTFPDNTKVWCHIPAEPTRPPRGLTRTSRTGRPLGHLEIAEVFTWVPLAGTAKTNAVSLFESSYHDFNLLSRHAYCRMFDTATFS